MTQIGEPAVVLGTRGSIEQGTRFTWNFFEGERTLLSFKGTAAEVYAAYQAYVAVAGYNPDVDSLSFDAGRGLAALEVAKIDDGAILYEVFPMEDRIAVEAADYYQTALADDAALTATETNAAFLIFNGSGGAPAISATWRTKQDNLLKQLARGETEVLVTRYALRETKRVSKRSSVTAVHASVDRVEAPPATSAVNTLIGDLNVRTGWGGSAGEWLRRGTVVRTIGARRWDVITEWWQARAWSRVHYGGTLEP